MNKFIRKNHIDSSGATKQCILCDAYLGVKEPFFCPVCRRGPLCSKHRITGKRECTSCTLDIMLEEVNALRGQEKNMLGFTRLLQFIFLLFSVYFITMQFGILEQLELLQDNIFTENLLYIGIGSAFFYIFSYIVVLGQRKKISDLESDIARMGMKRF